MNNKVNDNLLEYLNSIKEIINSHEFKELPIYEQNNFLKEIKNLIKEWDLSNLKMTLVLNNNN